MRFWLFLEQIGLGIGSLRLVAVPQITRVFADSIIFLGESRKVAGQAPVSGLNLA